MLGLLEGELLTSDTKDNFWSKEDCFFPLRTYITSRNKLGLQAENAANSADLGQHMRVTFMYSQLPRVTSLLRNKHTRDLPLFSDSSDSRRLL